jgi:hypothetical protein
MFCFSCNEEVTGGMTMHEHTRHEGAQTCWMATAEQIRAARANADPSRGPGTMRPECPACGGYLLPCTATATGIHPGLEPATYESRSARILRSVTERQRENAVWSPERGWHDED